ncbi:hypothetical protein Ahy_B06g084734 isoform B [Arachis hypogaea]|uniref:Uncharacterized protein n=1 Tax=Arachis hypogaea TaxID=3818 RepID=A0A444YSN1_ARAHY|nr:hypothetical protein Ahy_B06g084734 isoform B [Arachis hypogaea]
MAPSHHSAAVNASAVVAANASATASTLLLLDAGVSSLLLQLDDHLESVREFIKIDMTTSRGVADQPSGRGCGHGRGHGRVSACTARNSGSSPCTPTTPVTSQVAGASDQPLIKVSNPNYVPASTATTRLHLLSSPLSRRCHL